MAHFCRREQSHLSGEIRAKLSYASRSLLVVCAGDSYLLVLLCTRCCYELWICFCSTTYCSYCFACLVMLRCLVSHRLCGRAADKPTRITRRQRLKYVSILTHTFRTAKHMRRQRRKYLGKAKIIQPTQVISDPQPVHVCRTCVSNNHMR